MKIYSYIEKVLTNIVILDCATTLLRDYKFLPSKAELAIRTDVCKKVLDRLL